MTEADWLASTDPQGMLTFLHGTGCATDRKLRLFAVACFRRIWSLLDQHARHGLERTELYVDGLAPEMEVPRADKLTSKAAAYAAAVRSSWNVGEEAVQADLLRDIFGLLPFRELSPLPPYNDTKVQRLAQAAYDERLLPSGQLDPARLAVLCDALLDVGLPDDEILLHLRGEGPHWRGCWAVDAVVGRE
jgi:hypothetical protein